MGTKFKMRRIAMAVGTLNADYESPNSVNSNCFAYKNNLYEKLFDFCAATLMYDISLNSDINIEIVKDNGSEESLYLVLNLSSERRNRRNVFSRIRLLELCCSNDVSFLSISEEEQLEYNKDTVSEQVFNLLKEKHETDVLQHFDEAELEKYLRPTLRPYQTKAVKWMLHVESALQQIENYKEIQFIDYANKVFYINQYNLDITTFIPKIILPNGGILADEMGLGKTIEMLSLILLRQKKICQNDAFFNNLENGPSLPKIMKKQQQIFCICCNSSKRKKDMVKCIECNVLQHKNCVRKYSERDDPHICPSCWSKKIQLIPSRATVIFTPATIKKQWYTEIKNHVKTNLKVLMYSGVSNFWISPYEIANYDIVLIDYSILKREIYFSAENKSKCNFRNSKKYMRTESPLLKVLWYRVCLDEAQMVESTTSKASQMVKLLPAIHRWAVTGTPIQKSLQDIQGLLEFLDASPIYEKDYWKHLVNKFYAGDNDPFINILGKIMWRSSKKSVINELDIPEQLEKIHYIIFDDSENLFYSNERQICAQNFNEKVRKLTTDSAHSVAISKFDTYTLKKILEPLKKLRQDCTVPMLLKFQNNQSHVKKLLQPQELLEHLKRNNELECKSQIRLMASNYNGLAGIYMIREDYENAIKMYKSVISLSKEFSGTLSVDSLLQIHALHNMQIAYQFGNELENQNMEEIVNQLGELEWKYINTYFKKYLEALDCLSNTKNGLNTKFKELGIQNIEKTFINIFEEIDRCNLSDTFLTKIHEDNISYFNSMFSSYHRSIKTIEIYIINWLEHILTDRNQLHIEFIKFAEIIALIRPKEKLNSKVSNFVRAVFKCHLRDEEEEEKDSDNKEICDLCKSKISLEKYECLIFDKHMDERTQIIEGTWNPCVQEHVLKSALTFAKSRNMPSFFQIEEYENSLKIIDSLKREYKELSKLWIEIEYVAKAFDELEMCKMRLTAIEENDQSESKMSSKNVIYQIPSYLIEDTFQDLSTQLNESKLEFYKKLGRLKYIKHLEQNSEPDNCPICKTRPKTKYCVLDCGHIMCVLCLNEMTRNKINCVFNCAICRARVYKVYFVTQKHSENEGSIKGEYSSKIQKIISTILKLKMNDSKVKIIIFSHWQSILKIISAALKENCIEHRLMRSTKSIEEFKDENLNVTCMLMLLANGSKGLNLIESTHVFLVEPLLNITEELQAISRVHRIGQTKVTTVHRFIVQNTIEENIFNTMSKLKSLNYKDLTIQDLSKFICENNDYENEKDN